MESTRRPTWLSNGPAAVLLSPAYDREEYLAAESLGLRAIAAALQREGVRVSVADEVATLPDWLVSAVREADLVGIGTLFTRQIPDAFELAHLVRQVSPTAHITMGGQGVSFLWDRVLTDCPLIDSCCMYEGDDTVRELWRRIRAGAGIRGIDGLHVRVGATIEPPVRPRSPVSDLDELAFVSRVNTAELYRDGHATMYTSRGCAAHCSFCQSGNYGNRYHKLPKWRYRSARSIVDEIEQLRKLGVHAISMVDDDFLGGDGRGRQRAVEFAKLIADRGITISFSTECRVDEIDREILSILRAAGLRHVLIGIESANDPDDKLFAKRVSTTQIERAIALLRELDIDFSAGFIMFHPLSSPAGLRENLEFLGKHEMGTYRRVTNRLELYPGAPLLSYYRRRDIRFREERYRLYYDFNDPAVAYYYGLVRRVLRPFIEVEKAAERARFATETRVPFDAARLASVYRTTRRISAELVRMATHCLELVELARDSSHAEPASLETLVAATTDALAEEVRHLARAG